jgi:hypothetical protein
MQQRVGKIYAFGEVEQLVIPTKCTADLGSNPGRVSSSMGKLRKESIEANFKMILFVASHRLPLIFYLREV